MAKTKSAKYPHYWASDGEFHSISESAHNANVKASGFTPFTPPTKPPAGTYDPGLDASERANDRGILYLKQDTDTANSRADTQYRAGTEQLDTTKGWSLADLLSNRDRGLTDLRTALSRGSQQYDNDTADLQRGYKGLGQAQAGAATSSGFVDAGSIRASGAARAENQGRDQGRMDVANQERIADNTLQQGRLNEDYDTGVGRVNQSTEWQRAGLQSDYQYGVDDRASALSRAISEGSFFGQDTAAARMYQATSSGLYTPPQKPKNEFKDAQGPYQLIVSHGLRYKMRPNGKREPAGVAGRG